MYISYRGSPRVFTSTLRCPPPPLLYTRLNSFRLCLRMVSLTATKTKRMFSVSVAQVKWGYSVLSFSGFCSWYIFRMNSWAAPGSCCGPASQGRYFSMLNATFTHMQSYSSRPVNTLMSSIRERVIRKRHLSMWHRMTLLQKMLSNLWIQGSTWLYESTWSSPSGCRSCWGRVWRRSAGTRDRWWWFWTGPCSPPYGSGIELQREKGWNSNATFKEWSGDPLPGRSLTSLSHSARTWSYSLSATRKMMEVTFSKQWIHFLLSDLWPPTSTILPQQQEESYAAPKATRTCPIWAL